MMACGEGNPSQQRVRLLYRGGRSTVVAGLLIAAISAMVLWQVAPRGWGGVWFATCLLISIGRLAVVRAFFRAPGHAAGEAIVRLREWERGYVLSVILGGCTWGAFAWFFDPAWPPAYQLFVPLVIVGVGAGSIPGNSASFPSTVGFILPATLPLALKLLTTGQPSYVAIGLMSVVFAGVMTMLGHHFNRSLLASLQLGDRNTHLEEQLRLLLNSAGEGIYGLDLEGRTTFVNPAAARMLGYSVEELIGEPMHAKVHHSLPDGTPYSRERCPMYAAFTDGQAHHVTDEVLWRKDGSAFPIEYTSTPIWRGKVLSGAVVVFKDVTEQRRLHAQMLHGQKLESIGQLAAGIAHEINTPTQYVGDNVRFLADGFADVTTLRAVYDRLHRAAREGTVDEALLADVDTAVDEADWEYLADEVPRALRQAEEGVHKIAHIVGAMKEFSHPGSAHKEVTDLNHLVENTVAVARNEWKYVAELELQLDPGLPGVPCLQAEVGQVVLNLVVNAAHAIGASAARAADRNGRIVVATAVVGDRVEVRVTDNGDGIPVAVRGRIFDPFFTTKEVGKGTGQGLAIAHSVVVDKHAGTIDFSTDEGAGTTFIVGLPLNQAGAQGRAA